jgi:hypothetical protein
MFIYGLETDQVKERVQADWSNEALICYFLMLNEVESNAFAINLVAVSSTLNIASLVWMDIPLPLIWLLSHQLWTLLLSFEWTFHHSLSLSFSLS